MTRTDRLSIIIIIALMMDDPFTASNALVASLTIWPIHLVVVIARSLTLQNPLCYYYGPP